MKSRTKSTRENVASDSKSRKISEEMNRHKKTGKKDETETRRNLLKTLNLLQHHLKVEKKTSNAHLSASLYQAVKQSMPSSHSKHQLQDYTSSMQLGKEVPVSNDVNKSTASLMNLSTIHGKRRSNSTLDDYFRQKFGSPAKDEETIEKKLRVLRALKKSQQIVSKVSHAAKGNLGKENHLLHNMEGKGMLVEKLRPKKVK